MTRKNILIMSSNLWHSKLWFRRQHFARRFADSGWKVLYVNPSFTFLRPFSRKKHLSPSILLTFWRDIQLNSNLKIITLPPGIPFEGRYPQIRNINKKLFSIYIEHKTKKFFGNEPYTLICYSPFDAYLEMKNCNLTVYECVDDHSSYPEYAHIKEKITKAESLLMKKADIVTSTTLSLKEKNKKWRDDIALMPNGVDFCIFQKSNVESPAPEDLTGIRRPIIIYVGAIYEWFNLPLVRKMCDIHPEWGIVLIGPERILAKKTLPKNLYYLGIKDWKLIPSYLKAADVGIIPFIETDLTRNVNPLKLYDYFAVGLPCVSSFMFEIKKFEEPYILEIAKNDDDFIKAIERNIGKKDRKLDKKISIAKAHSWDKIFVTFSDLILSHM